MTDTTCATCTPCRTTNQPKACLLCGRTGVVNAMHFPSKNGPTAPPPGKSRIVMYSLCEHCASKRNSLMEIIEARIDNDLRAASVI